MRYKYLKLLFLLSFTADVTAQTVDLFNAENLEGWTVYGTEKWYVDEGELICESAATPTHTHNKFKCTPKKHVHTHT